MKSERLIKIFLIAGALDLIENVLLLTINGFVLTPKLLLLSTIFALVFTILFDLIIQNAK